MINHFPVLLPVIGVGILIVGVLLNLKESKTIGLVFLVLGAVAAVPTYLTGEPAEHVVKNYPNVTSETIETHEMAANYALVAIEMSGAIAAGMLYLLMKNRPVSKQSLLALVGLSLMASVLIARTAHLGGLIRHEEIEQGSFNK